MTGASLGLRTGSFGLLQPLADNEGFQAQSSFVPRTSGSLQQMVQNGGLQAQNSFIVRKHSRMSLSGSRERERFLPNVRRFFGRRKVGMLILVAIALLVFMTGIFTENKESSSLDFTERLRVDTYHVPLLLPRDEASNDNSSMLGAIIVCHENSVQLPSTPRDPAVIVAGGSSTTSRNPCESFAFPPPPPGERKRIGPRPCPVCYVPVEQAIASMPKFPSTSPMLRYLTYYSEASPVKTEYHGGSDFGGYPSLMQRSDSFNIKESMTVHCGFVKGCRPGEQTGFDIDAADLRELEQFHEVIVASAIFGNYDVVQQPKNVSEIARKSIPFYMFVDEETEAYLKNSSLIDSNKMVGLWRIIVVHNVPYADARRNGKVPKLLLHRLFPNIRYSIWIDGKLQLVVDPYQVLERFLWRQNATFAISRHYRRFDVFEEAEANKVAGKYENASIDYQIDFYRKEGLTPYSRAKLPITSDVPEGCVIIKEHIPITNLFTCLWFNEVDRFTSRDQLSFSTVRDKLLAKVNWRINMFLDCERRNFVVQAYHRDLLEQRAHLAAARSRSPPDGIRLGTTTKTTVRKSPVKRGRGDKRSGSRRHRKATVGSRNNISTLFL